MERRLQTENMPEMLSLHFLCFHSWSQNGCQRSKSALLLFLLLLYLSFPLPLSSSLHVMLGMKLRALCMLDKPPLNPKVLYPYPRLPISNTNIKEEKQCERPQFPSHDSFRTAFQEDQLSTSTSNCLANMVFHNMVSCPLQ